MENTIRKKSPKDIRIEHLEQKNNSLISENNELKHMLNDVQSMNEAMESQVHGMREIIEEAVAVECGCIVLKNATCYQDFIGILINNGYGVEIEPICGGDELKITIVESEDK